MDPNRPKISFTFPYRWLNEDREFLDKNLVRMTQSNGLNAPMHPRLMGGFINAYYARLKYHAYQPVKVNLTKAQLEKILKPVFPGAKCVEMETFFVQGTSKTALPVMELEIYY